MCSYYHNLQDSNQYTLIKQSHHTNPSVMPVCSEYPCDHYTSIINVTLMNTGCPRAPVHDAALQLLQLLDQRFFGNVRPLPAPDSDTGKSLSLSLSLALSRSLNFRSALVRNGNGLLVTA